MSLFKKLTYITGFPDCGSQKKEDTPCRLNVQHPKQTLLQHRFFFSSAAKQNLPELDLAFVISSSATNYRNNLKKTKEIIKNIVKKYGINKVHYSLGTLTRKLNIIVKFNEEVDSNSQFMVLVDNIPTIRGGSDLVKALGESPAMFTEDNGGRPSAKKILVVIIDNKSDSDDDDIKDAATLVKELGIRVIPVGLDKADKVELDKTTPVDEDVLTPSDDKTAEDIAKDIMNRALNGENIIFVNKCNSSDLCSVSWQEQHNITHDSVRDPSIIFNLYFVCWQLTQIVHYF